MRCKRLIKVSVYAIARRGLFVGQAAVVAAAFDVAFQRLVLAARGKGQALLDGEGTYRTRNGERSVWDGMVVIGDPQLEPAA